MKKLLIAFVAAMLMIVPAMAMDTISDADLDGVTGQAGVTVGFGGTQTVTISFDAITWGDGDGVAGAATAGYIQVVGNTGTQVSIQSLPGEKLVLDVATTAALVTLNSVEIPAGRTFISIAAPDQNITVTTADTYTIALTAASDTAVAVGNTVGVLGLTNLAVSVDQPSQLYIYANP